MNTDFHRLDEKLPFAGVTPKKAMEYLALFAVLTGIYYWNFTRAAKANACATDTVVTPGGLVMIVLGIFAFTSWPFAVMAAYDPTWRSKDAGHVFLAAYITTNVLWFHLTGCGFCIYAAAFKLIPYTFGALMAHELGALRFRWQRGE